MSLFNTVDFTGQLYDVTEIDHEQLPVANGASFPFSGSFQPAGGKMVEVLPESLRTNTTYRIYTNQKLFVKGDKKKQYHLIIHVPTGNVYKVVHAYDWQNTLINHRKYLVQEVKETDSGN